jgi:NAD(P)-dependent dehydrogenase (short-subunit alcohol dehydrogenase family)
MFTIPEFTLNQILLALFVVLVAFTTYSIYMPSLSIVRSVNAAFQPQHTPVAVFVGGTSGIGRAMAEVFGRFTQGKSDIIIVGRNKDAAESIFSSVPRPSDKACKREFIQCDATRIKNVQNAAAEILTHHQKINFLILSPGILTLKGRDETEEGLDTKLALHYYSRWKFIKDLLPSLVKASQAGEDAKVFSVLAAGKGGAIDLNDLGLKKTFSLSNAGLQAPTYNDLMMEV